MKKILTALAIVAMTATPVMAGGNNNGPIFGGDTTNTYNTTNQGGQGGEASSSANAGALAGAAVVGSGNSSNTNKNKNTNTNFLGQAQGQDQGQQQGQDQLQGQGQAQSTENANNSKQKTEVNVEGDVFEAANIPVASAVGGQVGASGGGQYQCLVPVSMGGQGMTVGLSFGSAVRDSECVVFQLVAQSNDPEVRHALSCLVPEYKQAMANIGRECKEVVDVVEAKVASLHISEEGTAGSNR